MSKQLPVMIVVLALFAPAMTLAGNGTYGACLVEAPVGDSLFPDGQVGCNAVCVNGLTEDECQFVKGQSEWFEDQTCGELDVPWEWEGGCQADVAPFGDQCYIIECSGFGQQICEGDAQGQWYEGDLTCGLGVPTVPAAGLAAMALLLLAGALVLLTVRGSVTSA